MLIKENQPSWNLPRQLEDSERLFLFPYLWFQQLKDDEKFFANLS